jgi:hypothetical protein
MANAVDSIVDSISRMARAGQAALLPQ